MVGNHILALTPLPRDLLLLSYIFIAMHYVLGDHFWQRGVTCKPIDVAMKAVIPLNNDRSLLDLHGPGSP